MIIEAITCTTLKEDFEWRTETNDFVGKTKSLARNKKRDNKQAMKEKALDWLAIAVLLLGVLFIIAVLVMGISRQLHGGN